MAAVSILGYHNVARAPQAALYPSLYIDPRRLRQQFELLRKFGLRGVSLGECLALLRRPARARAVALTFDDGYVDTLAAAAPLLREYGFTATCFVVSDAVGHSNRWDADFLGEHKSLMNRGQLLGWLGAGMEVGSHSRTHPRLPQLDAAAAGEEIAGSKAALETMLGVRIDTFCYPYGALNDTAAELVRRAGYIAACTTLPRTAGPADDPFRLPRYLIDGKHGLLRFLTKIANPFDQLRHRASGV